MIDAGYLACSGEVVLQLVEVDLRGLAFDLEPKLAPADLIVETVERQSDAAAVDDDAAADFEAIRLVFGLDEEAVLEADKHRRPRGRIGRPLGRRGVGDIRFALL